MSTRNSEFWRQGLATAALALIGAVTLHAHAQAATEAGLRVVRDPASGQLRAPTAAESAALETAASQNRASSGTRGRIGLLTGRVNPQPVVHADGTVQQELDESTMSYSVARRNADGTMSIVCLPGKDNAERLVKAPTMAAKSLKERQHEHK